jgi:hypothetical protein
MPLRLDWRSSINMSLSSRYAAIVRLKDQRFAAPLILGALALTSLLLVAVLGAQIVGSSNQLTAPQNQSQPMQENWLLNARAFDPIMHLARVDAAITNGELALAAKHLQIAESLAPNDPMLLRKRIAIDHRVGSHESALRGAMRLASQSPVDTSDAFGAIKELMSTDAGQSVAKSKQFAQWPLASSFVLHICNGGEQSASLITLLTTISSVVTPSDAVLQCVSERAANDGNASAARWLWLSNAPRLPKQIPNVVNGSFETQPSGSRFDWQISVGGDFRDGFAASIVPQSFRGGQKALSIRFNGRPIRSVPASQTVALEPGRYQLRYELRETAAIDRALDIALALRCTQSAVNAAPTQLVRARDALATTSTTDWRTVTAEFSVTSGCSSQILSTEFVSTSAATLGRRGSTLIDEVRIERVGNPMAAAELSPR